MKITNRASLSVADLSSLEAQVASLQSLSDVLKWGREQPASFQPAVITNVVKQDECTQDAIAPWQGQRAIVFAST